jgi:hypothetical protein
MKFGIDEGEWLAPCPSSFTPGRRTIWTHSIRGSVGTRASVDGVAKIKISTSVDNVTPISRSSSR